MGGQLASGQGGLLDGYLNSRDMFDGGGPGKSGDKFEGGGLLSLIANMFGKPLPPLQGKAAMPAVASRGYDAPRQDYTARRPMNAPAEYVPPAYDYAQSTEPPLSYGPPARALVGPALRNAMNPDRGPAMAAPAVGDSPEIFVPQTDYTPRSAAVGIPRAAAGPDALPGMAAPRPQTVSIVDEFEKAVSASQPMRTFIARHPDRAEEAMRFWLQNGKTFPGM